jgi:hypothetical protein
MWQASILAGVGEAMSNNTLVRLRVNRYSLVLKQFMQEVLGVIHTLFISYLKNHKVPWKVLHFFRIDHDFTTNRPVFALSIHKPILD